MQASGAKDALNQAQSHIFRVSLTTPNYNDFAFGRKGIIRTGFKNRATARQPQKSG